MHHAQTIGGALVRRDWFLPPAVKTPCLVEKEVVTLGSANWGPTQVMRRTSGIRVGVSLPATSKCNRVASFLICFWPDLAFGLFCFLSFALSSGLRVHFCGSKFGPDYMLQLLQSLCSLFRPRTAIGFWIFFHEPSVL